MTDKKPDSNPATSTITTTTTNPSQPTVTMTSTTTTTAASKSIASAQRQPQEGTLPSVKQHTPTGALPPVPPKRNQWTITPITRRESIVSPPPSPLTRSTSNPTISHNRTTATSVNLPAMTISTAKSPLSSTSNSSSTSSSSNIGRFQISEVFKTASTTSKSQQQHQNQQQQQQILNRRHSAIPSPIMSSSSCTPTSSDSVSTAISSSSTSVVAPMTTTTTSTTTAAQHLAQQQQPQQQPLMYQLHYQPTLQQLQLQHQQQHMHPHLHSQQQQHQQSTQREPQSATVVAQQNNELLKSVSSQVKSIQESSNKQTKILNALYAQLQSNSTVLHMATSQHPMSLLHQMPSSLQPQSRASPTPHQLQQQSQTSQEQQQQRQQQPQEVITRPLVQQQSQHQQQHEQIQIMNVLSTMNELNSQISKLLQENLKYREENFQLKVELERYKQQMKLRSETTPSKDHPLPSSSASSRAQEPTTNILGDKPFF